MVGTSSDVAFADAWLKGVRNFDVANFYLSAIRNASTVSTDVKGAGRKGIERSLFNGYTDDNVKEGLSWSTAGYINDFGIANLADALAKDSANGGSYKNYADDAQWYRARAVGYANLFEPEVGFFVARDPAGKWRWTAKDFSPIRWGGDYTAGRCRPGRAVRRPRGAGREARCVLQRTGQLRRGRLRRRDPRNARSPRRAHGPVRPLEPAVAPHHLDVRRSRPALEDPGQAARCHVTPVCRQRDRPGLPGR
jgi:hypothetical protein